jgi:hypothetical protein
VLDQERVNQLAKKEAQEISVGSLLRFVRSFEVALCVEKCAVFQIPNRPSAARTSARIWLVVPIGESIARCHRDYADDDQCA